MQRAGVDDEQHLHLLLARDAAAAAVVAAAAAEAAVAAVAAVVAAAAAVAEAAAVAGVAELVVACDEQTTRDVPRRQRINARDPPLRTTVPTIT